MVERPDQRPDHQAQARQATDVRQSKDRSPSGKIDRRDLSDGEHHRDCVRATLGRLFTIAELLAPADPAGGVICAYTLAGATRLPRSPMRTSTRLRDIESFRGYRSNDIWVAGPAREDCPVFPKLASRARTSPLRLECPLRACHEHNPVELSITSSAHHPCPGLRACASSILKKLSRSSNSPLRSTSAR